MDPYNCVAIPIAAALKPIMKPIQKPLGPIAGAMKSVNAKNITRRQAKQPICGEGNKENGTRIFITT